MDIEDYFVPCRHKLWFVSDLKNLLPLSQGNCVHNFCASESASTTRWFPNISALQYVISEAHKQLILLVRKELCPALKELMEHGLMEVSWSLAFVCVEARAWELRSLFPRIDSFFFVASAQILIFVSVKSMRRKPVTGPEGCLCLFGNIWHDKSFQKIPCLL